MKFLIVDAFTQKKFAGNQAAVLIVPDFPEEKQMQNIAAELNFSETAFLKKIDFNRYHIRWFTPNSEAPLCGHATLAAMRALLENGEIQDEQSVYFHSASGELTASVSGQLISLNFPRYDVQETDCTSQLQEVIQKNHPIYVGFAHNCFLMEFASCEEVVDLEPNLQRLSLIDCRALIVTAAGSGKYLKYDFISRYFAPKVGIDEDPVCASAHCRLIPYWSSKLQKKHLLAYQASSRTGILYCEDLIDRVLISGHTAVVAKGMLC